MCGIFGLIASPGCGLEPKRLRAVATDIFGWSETRGKDASGALVVMPGAINILKSAFRVKDLIQKQVFNDALMGAAQAFEQGHPFVVLGHTRMVTNGSALVADNNQPVLKGPFCLLHNGIIVNDKQLWDTLPLAPRSYEVDTEVFGALLIHYTEQGMVLADAVQAAFKEIQGANTIATLHANQDELVIATTNGSLYFWQDQINKITVFASERLIVERTIGKLANSAANDVRHLLPNTAMSLNLAQQSLCEFKLDGTSHASGGDAPVTQIARKVNLLVTDATPLVVQAPFANTLSEIEKLMAQGLAQKPNFQRCSRCLLPSSFPFIAFNAQGQCQFCANYHPRKRIPVEQLYQIAEQAKVRSPADHCLVPISGGRDSCYGLHYITKELGLKPVAYTYDWGFVTDLARRNISRMCGALGVEHVLVAADIRQKRENVRKNVTAWLDKPALGMIPLFMAGDKMFFYYASLLRKQMKLGPIMFSMNWLEQTGFKAGFAGVNELGSPNASTEGKTHGISALNIAKLAAYYAGQFIGNPGYINGSLPDTLLAFAAYYVKTKDYLSIFDYLPWDEQTIERTIIDGYEWETSPDTPSTWRIGDGTASFYNYVYQCVSGFSEHDTFRSNQIRDGQITREQGLALLEQENQPRLESFKWYCDTVGIDALAALQRINSIPKRFD
jgi:glutamine---fructose-6-phosphate transaminase (isomerizing)